MISRRYFFARSSIGIMSRQADIYPSCEMTGTLAKLMTLSLNRRVAAGVALMIRKAAPPDRISARQG
jgi:hypothetical protein